MSVVKLITISLDDFEATVPWAYALPTPVLLDIMMSPTFDSFIKTQIAFREVLSPELWPQYDQLNLLDLGKVLSQWIAKSEKLGKELAPDETS